MRLFFMDTNTENNPLTDANRLRAAFLNARRGSSWKAQVQRFQINWLMSIFELKRELEDGTYRLTPSAPFVLNERGHRRRIAGNHIRDRVVIHCLCDDVLMPALEPYLIYDNGASRVNMGVSFSRNRLMYHLRSYYSSHGSNDGYILLTDFSKYYDNILHDKALEMVSKHVDNKMAMALLTAILRNSEVDVSYLSDEEYSCCYDQKFDSLENMEVDPKLLTGEKMMRKSLNIGDQTSQVLGIFYPTPIDNYVKIVRGMKYYGRYMDDLYIISDSKEELQSVLHGIEEVADSLGIFINRRKTRIVKLSSPFRYLQIQYRMTESGRIVRKIHPKRVTCTRRKLKKLKAKLDCGTVSFDDIDGMFRSWMGGCGRDMTRQQKQNIEALFENLYSKQRRSKEDEISHKTSRWYRVEKSRSQWKQLHQYRERDRECIDTRKPYECHDFGWDCRRMFREYGAD